jgi:hypothetical protein
MTLHRQIKESYMTTKPSRASKPLSENAAVPNGTPGEPINPAVKFWLKKYRKFEKAGATGFVDRCRTIAFAAEKLSETGFERFCLEVGLNFSRLFFEVTAISNGEKDWSGG